MSVGNLLCLVSLSCFVSLHLFRHCLLPRRSENTFFSHFPLTKLDENVSTLDAIIFILYGSKEKSPFLMCKKPLFYIQKGAFSIIPLREKTMPARLCSGGLQESGSEESGICSVLCFGLEKVPFQPHFKNNNRAVAKPVPA